MLYTIPTGVGTLKLTAEKNLLNILTQNNQQLITDEVSANDKVRNFLYMEWMAEYNLVIAMEMTPFRQKGKKHFQN